MEKTVVKQYGGLSRNWIPRFLEANRNYVREGDKQFTENDPQFLQNESVKVALLDYN